MTVVAQIFGQSEGKARPVRNVLAGCAAAFTLSACATTINVPEEAVAFSSYSSAMMLSENVHDRVVGRLNFLHYVVAQGGDDLEPYFETSPELAIVLEDYARLNDDDKASVQEILDDMDPSQSGARLRAIDELSTILPGFDLRSTTPDLPESSTTRVEVTRNDSRLVFTLDNE